MSDSKDTLFAQPRPHLVDFAFDEQVAISEYRHEVQDGQFPTAANASRLPDEVAEQLAAWQQQPAGE